MSIKYSWEAYQDCTLCGLGYPIDLTEYFPKIHGKYNKHTQNITKYTQEIHKTKRRFWAGPGPAPRGRAGQSGPAAAWYFVGLVYLCTF